MDLKTFVGRNGLPLFMTFVVLLFIALFSYLVYQLANLTGTSYTGIGTVISKKMILLPIQYNIFEEDFSL